MARTGHPSIALQLCRGCHRPRASCHSWCGTGAPRCPSCTRAGRRCPLRWCWGSAGSPCQRFAGIAGPGCRGILGQAAQRGGRGGQQGHQASSHLGKAEMHQGLTPWVAPRLDPMGQAGHPKSLWSYFPPPLHPTHPSRNCEEPGKLRKKDVLNAEAPYRALHPGTR